MAAWCHGPAGSQTAKTVIRGLAELVGFGARSFGTLTSGGSLANYTGIKLALNEHFPSVRKQGLQAVEGKPAFYVSDQAHYSLDKIADMIGIGQEAMRAVPSDASARVQPGKLAEMIETDRAGGWAPFCVIGIAGTTTSGAVDPLAELGALCARERIWYHVDAAWGAAALVSDRHREKFTGIELADSGAIDPHKWFSIPFTAGGILVKDGKALRRGFEVKPHYVSDRGFTDHEDLNLFQFGVAGSRRLDALKVWLSLRQYGRKGYAAAIERQIALAEFLGSKIEKSRHLQLVTRPSLGVCCFRVSPPGFTGGAGDLDALQMKVQQAIEARGRVWISTSVLQGTRVIRFCVTSHLTRERHIDLLMEEIDLALSGLGA